MEKEERRGRRMFLCKLFGGRRRGWKGEEEEKEGKFFSRKEKA